MLQNHPRHSNFRIRIEQIACDSKYSRSRRPAQAPQERDLVKRGCRPPSTPPRGFSRAVQARVWPNGEYTVGYLPREKKRKADRDYDRMQVDDSQYQWVGRPYELEDGTVLRDITDKVQEASPKLGNGVDLSQTPPTPKKKYGLHGITGRGRKMVRNGAFLLEESCSKKQLKMGTLTIPKLTPMANKIICSNWHYLIRAFFQSCKRLYEAHNEEWAYVSVTEIQEKRFEKHGDCGLHLHFLFKAVFLKTKGKYLLGDNWVRSSWKRLLSQLLEKHPECLIEGNHFHELPTPNYRRDDIKKSASGYIAKYVSKGSNVVAKVVTVLGEEYIPTRWWSMSANLKLEVKKRTHVCRGDIATMLLDMSAHPQEAEVYYSYPVTITLDKGYEVILGYSGKLLPHVYSQLF